MIRELRSLSALFLFEMYRGFFETTYTRIPPLNLQLFIDSIEVEH